MFTDKIEKQIHHIVVRGSFVPSLYQPHRLAEYGLINEEEGKNEIDLTVIKNFLQYKLNWCKIECFPDRLQIGTESDGYFEMIRDLVIGIFKTTQTPISALGMNYDLVFLLQNKNDLTKFSNFLMLDRLPANLFKDPLISEIIINEPNRQGKFNGYTNIKINMGEEDGKHGIVFSINDHYAFNPENAIEENSRMIEILDKYWNDPYKRIMEISENIWDAQYGNSSKK